MVLKRWIDIDRRWNKNLHSRLSPVIDEIIIIIIIIIIINCVVSVYPINTLLHRNGDMSGSMDKYSHLLLDVAASDQHNFVFDIDNWMSW